MPSESPSPRSMPDVAGEIEPHRAGQLEWVGMDGIEVPLLIAGQNGELREVGARVDAFVNLVHPEARGIHMSRLYRLVDELLTHEPFSPCSVRKLLHSFLDSHKQLSSSARVHIAFDYRVRRPSLVSGLSGWRSYPATVTGEMRNRECQLELGVAVSYSSTCPCSAALSQQLVQERFAEDFPPAAKVDREAVLQWLGSAQGQVATPHAQRSRADVRIGIGSRFDFPLIDLIDLIESALQTPVQAAVKREDEQVFARLNAENTMFCEDAARRMRQVLEHDARVVDFWVRAKHFESLHAHNAVAVAVKGVAGGYVANDHASA